MDDGGGTSDSPGGVPVLACHSPGMIILEQLLHELIILLMEGWIFFQSFFQMIKAI